METYFTDRQQTGLTSTGSQTVDSSMNRVEVNFDVTGAWYTYMPIIRWFFDDDLTSSEHDVVTYEFQLHGMSFFSSKFVHNPLFGYANFAISQSSRSDRVLWRCKSIMDVLTQAGG